MKRPRRRGNSLNRTAPTCCGRRATKTLLPGHERLPPRDRAYQWKCYHCGRSSRGYYPSDFDMAKADFNKTKKDPQK